jgi:ATP-dependent DNA helicase 2 subunit 2
MDTADLTQITSKLKDYDPPVEVVLLWVLHDGCGSRTNVCSGVDFDDADSGYKEEGKGAEKVGMPAEVI